MNTLDLQSRPTPTAPPPARVSVSLSFPPATTPNPDNLQGTLLFPLAAAAAAALARAFFPSLSRYFPTAIKRVWVSSVLATSHPFTRSPLSLIVCRSLVKKIYT